MGVSGRGLLQAEFHKVKVLGFMNSNCCLAEAVVAENCR